MKRTQKLPKYQVEVSDISQSTILNSSLMAIS